MSDSPKSVGYVGAIARHREHKDRILMIQRLEEPQVFSPPDGHCNGHSFSTTCFVNFETKTGLRVIGVPRPLVLSRPIIQTKCSFKCSAHDLRVFEVDWIGELKLMQDKVKWINWMRVEEIRELIHKTAKYLKGLKLAEQAEDQVLIDAIKKSVEKEWLESPGLDPVWTEAFQELKII